MTDRESVTRLLKELRSGRREAFDEIIPLVYDPLRRLAARCLAGESPGHTLRPTALAHEVYLKLADADADWQDRAHFYAVAARVMRHILVDHARKRVRQKRSGGATHIPLDEAVEIGQDPPPHLLDLDRALDKLAARDERKSRVVELLFFGGLTYEESAAVLGISEATLHRELRMAKAWLYRELEAPSPEQSRHDAAV